MATAAFLTAEAHGPGAPVTPVAPFTLFPKQRGEPDAVYAAERARDALDFVDEIHRTYHCPSLAYLIALAADTAEREIGAGLTYMERALVAEAARRVWADERRAERLGLRRALAAGTVAAITHYLDHGRHVA